MRKKPVAERGTLHVLSIESAALKGNPPGDPHVRELHVYAPPGYDESRRYPLFMDVVGYTGSGQAHSNWKPFGLNLPERLDVLTERGELGDGVIAVMPDCFTAYGGNQYINSGATGRYMDYLLDEVVPLVESRFSCHGDREHRAIFGKSSGGYGAMVHGLLRPDFWGGIACHSGDAYFEYAYLADMPDLLDVLSRHEESVEKFLTYAWKHEKLSRSEGMALMMIGMAAHYDPDPNEPVGFQLPVDLHTGEIRWDRWERWLEHDPVRLIDSHADNLRQLRGIYIDCGTQDQFKLLWGARQMHRKLNDLDIRHEYQEFDDNHSDIDYRMNKSLPFLYRSMA
ncbi:MAG: enterochelin esterase [Gammaproteobacteria bacterium]|jgi:S-formylglutathione hydrolase FrmB|nr:enterochelin esterase [Gammaproteobacteria bacterium]